MAGDPVDGAIREVLVEVLGLAILLRGMVVPHHRDELVHVGCHEAIRVIEALPARPAVEGADLGDLVERGVIPLAEGVVHVAGLLQVVGHRLGGGRHDRVVAREAHRGEGVAAETDGVRIASGHQGGARRRAQRGGVEVVVAQPVVRQAIDGRSVDQTAEAGRHLRETDIVEKEDEDVGRSFRGPRRLRPPLDRILILPGDLAFEFLGFFRR